MVRGGCIAGCHTELLPQARLRRPASHRVAASNLQIKFAGVARRATVGTRYLRFLGLHIYDALLWVENAIDSGNYAAHPLALELRYARSLYGSLIAERSLREMERAGRSRPRSRSAGWPSCAKPSPTWVRATASPGCGTSGRDVRIRHQRQTG